MVSEKEGCNKKECGVMSFRIEMRGDSKLRRALHKASPFTVEAANQTLFFVAAAIKHQAQLYVPIRTGRLFSSIYFELIRPMTYVVGAKAPYAGYVEFGTSKMSPRPYIRPAIMAVQPNINKILREELKKSWNKQ